jgi:hypothetical protein
MSYTKTRLGERSSAIKPRHRVFAYSRLFAVFGNQ